MSKNFRIVALVLVAYLVVVFLHLWLNIGWQKLGLFTSADRTESFRVGFLPVT